MTGRPPKDLTNRRYHSFLVIERTGEKRYGHAVWKCLCDCGKEFHTTNKQIHRIKSCGCYRAAKKIEIETPKQGSGVLAGPTYRRGLVWGTTYRRAV